MKTDPTSKSRRKFVATAPLAIAGAVAACSTPGQDAPSQQDRSTPVAPPTFGTLQETGPEVSTQTFAEAEKLMQVKMSPADRAMAAESWGRSMAGTLERRTGPRTLDIGPNVYPACVWNPILPGVTVPDLEEQFIRNDDGPGPLPLNDADIAYAPVTKLSRWIEKRELTSERLTRIYIARIDRFDPQLQCVITLLRDEAIAAAIKADAEILEGRYRGPLHGIPWGGKDLLDTAGILTTYGAEPYKTRVPDKDSAVVALLEEAGAVLLAKLSLGALALNDEWFGGYTVNPWLPEEGASGSSAGPGAATTAGLVGFSIGSETGGSIISPAMRCGVAGLRPTFGRVPRTGAMTLCWSFDKLGPMTRTAEDAMLVLSAISSHDAGDMASVRSVLDFNAKAPIKGLRVGYFPSWMDEAPATDVDRAALQALIDLGLKPVEVSLPDWPFQSIWLLVFAEAAAAFEDLTLSGKDATLKIQRPDAWPNLFREARFLSAVDFIQADRMRRLVALEMARIFSEVDILLVPSLRDEGLSIGNATGHPSLTIRTGFVHVSNARSDWAPGPDREIPEFDPPRRVPHGVTLIGRLFDEGTIGRVGIALEQHSGAWKERPTGF